MDQPNWSKLSENLCVLRDKPWQFGLFRAINLLEREWAEKEELSSGLSSRVLITPNKELGFPAADIKKGNLLQRGRGTFHLETSYSGLYGADAAMPHYVLEQAASDGKDGQRTRAFLDIFNHQYYCLLYQAWKKSQLNIKGLGAQQFDDLLNAVLSSSQNRDVNSGVASLKTTSASGMAKLLNEEFGLTQINVDDSSAHWQPIGDMSCIGNAGNSVLGESLILGDKVLVSGGKVIVDLGTLAANDAVEFFPGQVKGERLYRLIDAQLPSDLPWNCKLSIAYEHKAIQRMGQMNITLGIDSHIGEVSKKITEQIFKDSQYKKRSAQLKCA